MLVVLGAAGCALWMVHAEAWSLGRRFPVLNHDGARHALAARELARHGRLATTFALPLTLVHHPRPPWPLEAVEPGMVGLEALALRIAPLSLAIGRVELGNWNRPDQLEWLIVPIPFTCFLLLGLVTALAALKILRAHSPSTPGTLTALIAGIVGLVVLLDAETQHLATGGNPALPFTLGVLGAVTALVLGLAPLRPFRSGLIAGAAVLFRTGAAWVGPLLAISAALTAAPGGRRRVFARVLLGFVLPLLPWWIHQATVLGSPAGAHPALALWDGIQMRSLFAMLHVPHPPDLPGGFPALWLMGQKIVANLPGILLRLTIGLGALQIGALGVAAADRGLHRNVRIASRTVLALVAGFAFATAATVLDPGALHAARMLLTAGGTLAALAVAGRLPALAGGARIAQPARAVLLLMVLAWGGWQTARGASEARVASGIRGTPSTLTLLQVAVQLSRDVEPGQPVVSNLGPILAWHARRPVIHLPLAPEDLEALRSRVELRHVLLAFRGASEAWPGWAEVLARPLETRDRPELNVQRVRTFRSADGLEIVWLELGPSAPQFARRRD